jgi:hypothetical protein
MRPPIGFFPAFCAAGLLFAQDQPPAEGPLKTQGAVTVGYRLNDLSGRREKFNELFNLRSGPRLFDFDFGGRAEKNALPFVDNFQLLASGLGDPFPTTQFTMRKAKLYDIRATHRQSYYYWDRNDSAVLPSALRGLTTNHNWSTVRRFTTFHLLLHASNRLKFRAEYGRNSRDGMNATTRTMDYFGSPASWGAFLRDNPYYVEAPLTESSNRFAGGLDYTVGKWSLHYTAGYQIFNQAITWNNVAALQRSINTDSATTGRELLNSASWSEQRTLRTPSSEFFYNGAVNPRVDLRGSFLFFRYRGPATLDAAFAGTARGATAGTFAPYSIAMNSRARLTEPNYVVDQGASLKINEWWNAHADYRYNRFTQNSEALFYSLRDAVTPFNGETEQRWKQGLHQMDLNLEFIPTRSLVIRPGVRLMRRDTEVLIDGVRNARQSRLVNTVWPIASVAFLPSRQFSLRVDLQSITNGVSYTRITPHTDVSSRWIARYQPLRNLSIENNFVIRNRKLVAADFRNNIRSNATSVSWAWNDRFSIFGGFSYDSFLATASVDFLRGTAPLNTTWRDQTVNRIWQGGLFAQPVSRLGLSFSGNFIRSTGAGEISLERPTFGPLTWPMGTATIHYDFPRLGRLALDLQRTYYVEEIVRGNDFGANLLTIRWTYGF